jgi:RNA polymerase sigma-70 factor, ECF subfamily
MKMQGPSGEPGNVNPADEDRLIGEAQRGSPEAFEELVRRYDAGVLRLALRLARSEDTARDIYQETFLRAFRSIRGFRGQCAFGTWLYRIVANLCLDHARRQAGRRDGSMRVPESGRADDWTVEAARLLVDRRPSSDPEKALEAADIRRRIAEALGRLPERERLVFELRHDQGMRLAAVAGILETSEETVRNCLYRAHQRLRASLADLHQAAAGGSGGRAGPVSGRPVRLAGRVESLNGVE